MQIRQHFTEVTHSQANGQVEVTNRTIVDGIGNRLEKAREGWANELHRVLWENRTSPKELTGKTPYSLLHGVEVVVQMEVGMGSARFETFNHETNGESLREY